MQWKRAREAEEREINTCAPRESGPHVTPLAGTPGTEPKVAGDGEVLPLHLSAEELHQRRVRQSAALGISTAVRLEQEELEAAHKVKVASGMDRKSLIGSKLEKLMKLATSSCNSDENGNGNDGKGEVAAGMPALGPSTSSIAGSSAPLVFQPSALAAGGYMMKEDKAGKERHKAPTGKPSSTILIRFLCDGPPPDIFEEGAASEINGGNALTNGLGTAGLAFLENIQGQCARYGVVRSVQPALLTEEQRAAVRARLEGGELTPAEVEQRYARELVRVLVRFDTVAGAFKAVDALRQSHANWSVCFFPTRLFDEGVLGPSDGEPLCGT